MERLIQRLSVARQALSTLQQLASLAEPSEIERDAALQRFEYTIEAVWHAVQRFLLVTEGLAANSPKGCVRTSCELGLLSLEEGSRALEMIDDRNRTAHTYDRALAEKIFKNLSLYAPILDSWLRAVEAHANSRPS